MAIAKLMLDRLRRAEGQSLSNEDWSVALSKVARAREVGL